MIELSLNGGFLGEKSPKIDVNRFPKSVTVKAGRPLDLEIPFEAFPLPAMSWTKDGKPVQSGSTSPCKTNIEPRKCSLNMYEYDECD